MAYIPEEIYEPEWERQPKESDMWFDRFHAYLLMGSGRSLLAVYNRERQKQNKPKVRFAPAAWKDIAKDWQWRERAAAWDREQRRIADEQDQQARKHMRTKHLEAAKAWQALAVRTLHQTKTVYEVVKDPLTGEEKSVAKQVPIFVEDPAVAFRIWDGGVKNERLAMGLPTKLIEYTELSDAELRQRYADLVERITSGGNGDEDAGDEAAADFEPDH